MSSLELLSQEAQQEAEQQQTMQQAAQDTLQASPQLAVATPIAGAALAPTALSPPPTAPPQQHVSPAAALQSASAASSQGQLSQNGTPPRDSAAAQDSVSHDLAEAQPGCLLEVQKTRAMIATETEAAMTPLLGQQGDSSLAQWLAKLQDNLKEEARRHKEAQHELKQVDNARDEARKAYRDDQGSKEKQEAWKGLVIALKTAQTHLRTTREAFYKASAAVDVLVRETRVRSGQLSAGVPVAGGKRKRQVAPEEGCPYCSHTYTVRDGFSAKTDEEGERLHLRKCQCREKTPPCRNCPKCKDNVDIMSLTDIQAQFSVCQLKFRCEICSCKCPGAGKWIENDDVSRQSYAQRTSLRHGQLQQLGWGGSISVSATFGPSPQYVQQHGMMSQGKVKRPRESRRTLKRLPQDIRHQLEQLHVPPELLAKTGVTRGAQQSQQQGHHGPIHPDGAEQTGQLCNQLSPPRHSSAAEADMLVVRPASDGATASLAAPAPVARPPVPAPAPLPVLPGDVVSLVEEVFAEAAGPAAAVAVRDFLQRQRVTELSDLQYLELPWLQEALVPAGVTPLLLNKFLGVARRRTVTVA